MFSLTTHHYPTIIDLNIFQYIDCFIPCPQHRLYRIAIWLYATTVRIYERYEFFHLIIYCCYKKSLILYIICIKDNKDRIKKSTSPLMF